LQDVKFCFPVADQGLIFTEHDRYITNRIVLFLKKDIIRRNIDQVSINSDLFLANVCPFCLKPEQVLA
jgi:hypothetical protein